MGSDALHLKYRPKDWGEVLGQDKIVKSIRSVLAKKSSHAFLFTGMSGVGKTTVGRLIAKEVKCENMNLVEIDGATHTGIDAMREVTRQLDYAPVIPGGRVIIVDECHAISKQSWQSLLKSLEEPPPDVYWILCTTDPDKVPKNVKTRCAAYEFVPVETEVILELLKTVKSEEALKPGPEGLRVIAESAQGSVRQALVNLAACGHLKKSASIEPVLQVAGESKETKDLCRMLLAVASGKKIPWKVLAALIRTLDTPPETTRILVSRYMAAVALNGNSRALGVIDAFSQPFLDRDGNAPLVLACANVWATDED